MGRLQYRGRVELSSASDSSKKVIKLGFKFIRALFPINFEIFDEEGCVNGEINLCDVGGTNQEVNKF